MDEKCKQYNLRACVNIASYWGVKDDGTIDFTNPCGEGDADTDNFDAYYCEGCGNFFPEWSDALEHVGVKKLEEAVGRV